MTRRELLASLCGIPLLGLAGLDSERVFGKAETWMNNLSPCSISVSWPGFYAKVAPGSRVVVPRKIYGPMTVSPIGGKGRIEFSFDEPVTVGYRPTEGGK